MPLFDDIPFGAVISAIEPLPSDPNYRRLRVGRRSVATLRASDVELLKLQTGVEWSASLAAKVKRLLATDAARREAMKFLGRRAASMAEIADRLEAKGHDRAVAVQIAKELRQAGWIDDALLADAVIHQTTRSKPAGRRLIQEKLKTRKIPTSLIERTLAQRGKTMDESAAAMQLAVPHLRRMTSLPNHVIQRRLAGMLARRGFDDDTIADVMDRLQLCPTDAD